MPTYRIVRKSDNEEVLRYCSASIQTSINGSEYPESDYDHVEFVEEPQPQVHVMRRVTRLAFRNRFTLAEKAAIEMAALDNPQVPAEQRQMAAMLRAFMGDVDAATFVDLDNSATRAGVMQLEQIGLLAQGRAAEILDAQVTDEEAYRGE